MKGYSLFDKGGDSMLKAYYRAYQQTMKGAAKIIKFRVPQLLEGENSVLLLPAVIRSKGVTNVLVVTDQGIAKHGLHEPLLQKLEKEGLRFSVYDKTEPNPTITHIEEAVALYKEQQCNGIVAFGGGSPIDCAKAVGARIAKPHLQVPQMKGLFKIRKEIVPLFAVPTTSGTGSEATVAAVVSNSETHEKYPITDPVLIPIVAVLDPLLTVKLPKHVTSTTGMDALTHAVEAYIGRSNTKETLNLSREAIQLIYDNLYQAYENGENIEARKNMQRASFLAGMAFTRAYVGNIHAIAHTLGGFYNIPHGLANAVIMPHMLRFYGDAAVKPLAELADLVGIGIGVSEREQANLFIEWIDELNEKMGIPSKLAGIENRDIPTMAKRALAEANPLYPVPKIMNYDEMFYMYQMIKE